ncbi:MAG: PEP-CTERM sorting domain-containing protein [Aquabacterium sp.]
MKKHMAPALVMTCLMATGIAAHASVSTITLNRGDRTWLDLGKYGTWDGGIASLAFSDLLVGALNIANIGVSAIGPGVLTDADVVSVSAPIQSLTGVFDTIESKFTATQVSTTGGAVMSASALLPSGKKNSATTGGSLALTNLTVDLTTSSVYATLVGGNGVGTLDRQLIWHYHAIEGATSYQIFPYSADYKDNKLFELTITPEAFDLFSRSLGLTAFGKSSMAGITDYGVISSSMEAFAIPDVPHVPEPSTNVLMGLGLSGLAFAARRTSSSRSEPVSKV